MFAVCTKTPYNGPTLPTQFLQTLNEKQCFKNAFVVVFLVSAYYKNAKWSIMHYNEFVYD